MARHAPGDRRPGHGLLQALAREHRLGPQQLAVLPLQLVVPRAELAELDLALGVARLDLGEARAQQGRVLGQPVRGGGHSRSLAPEIPRAWELGSARAAGAEWALANSRGEYKACRAARQGGSSLFTQYELIAEHEQKRGLQNWY